jgi:hypothetical protein
MHPVRILFELRGLLLSCQQLRKHFLGKAVCLGLGGGVQTSAVKQALGLFKLCRSHENHVLPGKLNPHRLLRGHVQHRSEVLFRFRFGYSSHSSILREMPNAGPKATRGKSVNVTEPA